MGESRSRRLSVGEPPRHRGLTWLARSTRPDEAADEDFKPPFGWTSTLGVPIMSEASACSQGAPILSRVLLTKGLAEAVETKKGQTQAHYSEPH